MAITYIPVVGQFTYRASPASPAAGGRVVFVAASDAIVDGEVITLPTKLSATLTSTGALPTGFTLPTLPGGVYYVVHEAFSGAREDYTIFVQPSDTLIDLATVVPAVPPEPLVQYLRVQDIGVSVGSQAIAADHETRIDALETGSGGGGGADLSDNAPHALGTAAAGTGTKASRDDHVHAMPTASDVGADASGAATAAVAAHVGAADPHGQYLKEADAATVATTGAYADLSGRPTLGTAAAYDVGDFDAAGAAASAQSAAQTYADNAVSSAVVGLLDDRGSYDASGNVFPSTGGSGSGGAVLKGDLWTVSVAGTLGGNAVTAGDVVRALIDTPGQTASNWAVTENNLGYVPEPAQTLVTQAEAEAGADTNRKAWSVLRVWQAIAAWWAASSAKSKLDGIAAGATVGADWPTNVTNKPTLGTAAAANTGDFATAAQGTKADSALQPITVGTPSSSSGTLTLDFAGKSRAVFATTLTENVTTVTISNLPSSVYLEYEIHYKQDGTGSRTVAQPASHKALGGSDTAVASAANAVTVLSASSVDGGTTWRYAMQESA